MFLYCVTCQCLTPLGDLSEVTQATGIYTEIIRADSQQDAERISREELAAMFHSYAVKITENGVGALDEDGHIVNYFWNFRSHRI